MIELFFFFYNICLGSQADPSIASYMAQMDKELASTSLGSSFVKKPTSDNNKQKVCNSFCVYQNIFF